MGDSGGSLVSVRALVGGAQKEVAVDLQVKQAAICITSLAIVCGSLSRIAVKHP
jgi:hypothetical protein